MKEKIGCAVIGYCMSRRYWGQGIMSEAFNEVIRFLFEKVEFNRIEAYHYSENEKSGRVMQKCGLKYEGCHRQYTIDNKGKLCDLKVYAILKSEYMQNISNK